MRETLKSSLTYSPVSSRGVMITAYPAPLAVWVFHVKQCRVVWCFVPAHYRDSTTRPKLDGYRGCKAGTYCEVYAHSVDVAGAFRPTGTHPYKCYRKRRCTLLRDRVAEYHSISSYSVFSFSPLLSYHPSECMIFTPKITPGA